MDSINKHILTGATLLLLLTGCGDDEAVSTQLNDSQVATNKTTAPSSSESNGSSNGRDLYPDLAFIEAETIRKDYLNYTIVDVRSNYEYRVLRMADSVSIPANDMSFEVRLRNLVRKHKQTVVLYGNGGKDRHAHDAARIAKRNKIDNILVFDGDILSWAENAPEYTELNGKAIEAENELIEASALNEKLVSEEEFAKKFLQGGESVLLDIRDDVQTNQYQLQSSSVNIPLDHQSKLLQFLNRTKLEDKTLLIYDDFGLQSRWLIYQLEKLQIENYYFLKNGIAN